MPKAPQFYQSSLFPEEELQTEPQQQPQLEPQQPQELHPEIDCSELFARLAKSSFRSGFHLKEKDREYIREKGLETIRRHAADFVEKRLAPAYIPNDGKQTPMRGHPVFVAQHATACCCRGCFRKWHHIPEGRELTRQEREYAVGVLMEWIKRELEPR